MQRKAFTLVELLNVMAIIAILSAIFLPAARAARNVAYQYNAKMSMKNLAGAMSLYMTDNEEVFPPAMYLEDGRYRTWFGYQDQNGAFDVHEGILTAYTDGKHAKDPIHKAKPYFGDNSGFGYNWGYLGSDVNITLDYSSFPNCVRPAAMSEIEDPESTVAFATSAYFNAPWLKGGDGMTYDFGFVDPPKYWRGNPNVAFRYGDPPTVDIQAKKVTPKGRALVATVSGGATSVSPGQLKDAMFERRPIRP
jgi:prepilin-type N-terminal cleavage/methylation domain-containing protein